MLRVRPFRQSPGFCGPACLKMVLEYYGIHKSEGLLARLSGCSKKRGVKVKGLLKAVKRLELKGFVRDYASFKDVQQYLRRGIPVIVSWFSVDEGHYSVVVGLDKRFIYLQDPQLGRLKRVGLSEFRKVWFDFEGEPFRSKSRLRVRQMIVIQKPKSLLPAR